MVRNPFRPSMYHGVEKQVLFETSVEGRPGVKLRHTVNIDRLTVAIMNQVDDLHCNIHGRRSPYGRMPLIQSIVTMGSRRSVRQQEQRMCIQPWKISGPRALPRGLGVEACPVLGPLGLVNVIHRNSNGLGIPE